MCASALAPTETACPHPSVPGVTAWQGVTQRGARCRTRPAPRSRASHPTALHGHRSLHPLLPQKRGKFGSWWVRRAPSMAPAPSGSRILGVMQWGGGRSLPAPFGPISTAMRTGEMRYGPQELNTVFLHAALPSPSPPALPCPPGPQPPAGPHTCPHGQALSPTGRSPAPAAHMKLLPLRTGRGSPGCILGPL